MKININKLDEYYEDSGGFNFHHLTLSIADSYKVHPSDVRIWNCEAVGEWVIEVKGRFEGYVSDWEMEEES